jgi:hypothetical protein
MNCRSPGVFEVIKNPEGIQYLEAEDGKYL